MSVRPSSSPERWTWFSPWMIMGSVCILAGILMVLAVKNINREKEFMERALLSEANVLMRSLEASSRTGMMGMGWGRRQIQLLMEETAEQPDVLYVAIMTSRGQVVAHSDPARVGATLTLASVPPSGKTIHGFSKSDDTKSFEVIRSYQPWQREPGRQRGKGRRTADCPTISGDLSGDLLIMVGLDPKPFEEARTQDLQQTLLLFGIMLLVGAAGFLSLVWAQSYRSARRSLQDIRAFTSTIINQMPVGLIATDLNGRIRTTNEAARKILRSSEPKGRLDLYPCFLPIARQLGTQEAIVGQEVHFKPHAREADSVPLLVNASVIRDGERRSDGHVFLFTDMTEIKHLEEQLRRGERLAALGRLAAGVAHEIRNPLSSIKGFATILVSKLGNEVDRLNRVVTELLDFARPTELHKRPVPCRELIDHTLSLIEGDALHQGIRVESSVRPETLQAEIDPDRFAQVLLNLYLNALQAMESGGSLSIGATAHEGQITIAVSDTGTGIPPENIPHIFDPYFTTKPRGVGLGLANVHKLVEAHGGHIEVASTPGQGTAFHIMLPQV